MDGPERRSAYFVEALARLHGGPGKYSFFAAVRLLERMFPMPVRPGGAGPYRQESIRFRHSDSLAFSSGELSKFEAHEPRRGQNQATQDQGQAARGDAWRFELTSNFLGLTGSASPLPSYIAEEVALADPSNNIRRDFLDIFHHRLLGLLYRGVSQLDLVQEFRGQLTDDWSLRALAWLGFDGRRAEGSDAAALHPELRSDQLLRLAPLLSTRIRSAAAMGRILDVVLEDFLPNEARCNIEEFVGAWTRMDPGQQMRLGARNHRLGVDAVIGQHCLHRAGRARVVIGPMAQDDVAPFLEGGPGHERLREALRQFSTAPIDFELVLAIRGDARRTAILGRSRLNIDFWLYARDRAGSTRVVVPLDRADAADHAGAP